MSKFVFLHPIVFEKNMKKRNERIFDISSWRVVAASQSASQNINITGCSFIQEKLFRVRLDLHFDYGLSHLLEKFSNPVTRDQCLFKVVLLMRSNLRVISLREVLNGQLKSFVRCYSNRSTSKVT